ncbi:MAG: hypothetical protein GKR94_14340 [Gammaproteobacteria bacterium]|nr:hypothetical protein [Gammaproteobacteria bacterium]
MSTVLELRESSPPLDIVQDVAMELLRSRRTIHDFTTQEPPAGLIEEALEVARWAPNHHLTQPWRFYLVGAETREAIARLNGDMVAGKKGAQAGEAKYERWRNIPGWLVVTCENHDDPIRAKEDYAATCCAIHNITLKNGLGHLRCPWLNSGAISLTKLVLKLASSLKFYRA